MEEPQNKKELARIPNILQSLKEIIDDMIKITFQSDGKIKAIINKKLHKKENVSEFTVWLFSD